MPSETDKKVSAADIARRMNRLGEEARALLRPDLTPPAYVLTLEQHKLHADALRFVAYWLPKELAIWWGALCVWRIDRPAPARLEEAALASVVGWLREPGETTRRRAEAAARLVGLANPAGALAMATFWSSGSMAPPGLPVVEPDATVVARTVAGAVLACSLRDPAQTVALQHQFVALGLEVAEGKNHWKETKP